MSTKAWREHKDPPTEMIPVCIIHEFPSDINHTIQWAQEQLKAYFCEGEEGPAALNGVIVGWLKDGNLRNYVNTNQVKLKVLQRLLSYTTKRPQSFEDCVAKARLKFDKWYRVNVLKLLKSHPSDKIEKYKLPDGTEADRPFWTLPRRLPTPIEFDPDDGMCQSFIYATANLYARLFGIECTMDSAKAAADFAASAVYINIDDYE